MSDIKVMIDNNEKNIVIDPEYWLANFIFYAKLTSWENYKNTQYEYLKPWDSGYGVCSPECEHGDLEYEYIIYPYRNAIYIQIWKWDWKSRSWTKIFDNTLENAFSVFKVGKTSNGTHISEKVFK